MVRFGPRLQTGRRRLLDALRAADDIPDALLDPRLLGVDHQARRRIYDRLPRAGDADDRRVLRAGSGAVLSVLRRRPHSDVSHHRHLGRQAARLCELQILPLHARGFAADADRHSGDVQPGRHDRHSDAAEHAFFAANADVAVAGVLRLLRGENADVAGAHLVAGRACRGADGGLGDPGGDPAENGRLWLHPLLAADVPGRLGSIRAAGLRACR